MQYHKHGLPDGVGDKHQVCVRPSSIASQHNVMPIKESASRLGTLVSDIFQRSKAVFDCAPLQVYKDGQTHPSNINPGLRDLSTHLKTGTCQDEGPSSSPLHPPNTHIHHMMTPSFAPENGDVSWVVTLNTPQEDIGRQVDRVSVLLY